MKTDTATAIGGWLAAHMEVFPDLKWPTAETDTLGILPDLRRRLVREGFTDPEILAEISRRMLASGDRLFTLQDHIKQIFIAGHAIYRARGRPDREPETLATAREASQDCGQCHGVGLVTKYRQQSYDLDRRDNKIACHCTCPIGRKLRESHRESDRQLYNRIYDLAAHQWLMDPRYDHPPESNGVAEDGFMARCDRISDWFENQSEDVKTRWRAEARPGLPVRVADHLIDQFVVGVIAHRFPEFDGDADAGRGRVATAEAAPY